MLVMDAVEELMSMDWVVAAEVNVAGYFAFTPRGLFFPVAYATEDEWAGDLGLDEVEGGRLVEPHDWMAQQESSLELAQGSYPHTPGGLRFWREASTGRFFMTLEVNAREFAIVRQMAAMARRRGLLSLIAEEQTNPAAGCPSSIDLKLALVKREFSFGHDSIKGGIYG
ncbi:hypothetical protein [Burkholderia oklahomensis]|uniref:hypothetical protein n=1 Tax=Burkholderia oklahomensis TaxID=342113 RepID=UPI00016A90D5|nr:hypothetical protein [Burkholderia oklahomensis]AJX33164.1 hypothetical protein BG90_2057 [Burkholderia oklahomensis C6786]AOI44813.1 hypothetical protein WI23_02760 [Burkholderia oklahomensis C6786]KUY65279.1 hypothetical protein WI23_04330 [Burkholderia oklahomensis C6786]MBI0359165.1 hypothetical protein [Burkholderia oklahomensis]SUW57978.1 Uncharacterised protein [Burkholderia oklahomensis]